MPSATHAFQTVADVWWPYVAHATWQSMLVGAVIMGAVLLMRRWSAPLRYGLLIVALLKFAVPPMLALPTGVFGFVEAPAPGSIRLDEHAAAIRQVQPAAIVHSASIQPAVATGGAVAQESARTFGLLHSWKAILLCIHLLGSASIAIWMLHSVVSLRRVCRKSARVTGGPLYSQLAILSERIGLRRPVRLLVGPNDSPPTAFGIFRPTILLPVTLAQDLPDHEIEAVLAHELAHHRRRDTLFIWLENLLLLVWWFNPVLWALVRTVRRTREDCCDDLVLGMNMTDNSTYCGTLVHAASGLVRCARASTALGFADRFHPLGRRLRRIMDAGLRRSSDLSVAGLLVVVALGLLLLPGLRVGASDRGGEEGTGLCSLHGVVTGPDGKIAPGARVAAVRSMHDNGDRIKMRDMVVVEVMADDDGWYRFERIPSGFYRVRAMTDSACGLGRRFVTSRDHGPQEAQVDIQMRPMAVTGGTVLDVRRQPVEGARLVVLTDLDEHRSTSMLMPAITDERGRYKISYLWEGTHLIEASAHGYAPSLITDAQAGLRDNDVILYRGATVTGTVRFKDTGEPASKMQVAALQSAKGSNPEILTMTDEEGRYSVDGLSPGVTYTMFAENESQGYVSAEDTAVTLKDGEIARDVDVVLSEGGSISGTVKWRKTGEPVAGVTVTATRAFAVGHEYRLPRREAISEADGTYTCSTLPAGRYLVECRRQEGAATVVRVDVDGGINPYRTVDVRVDERVTNVDFDFERDISTSRHATAFPGAAAHSMETERLPGATRESRKTALSRMDDYGAELDERVTVEFAEGNDIRDVLRSLSDSSATNILLDERVVVPSGSSAARYDARAAASASQTQYAGAQRYPSTYTGAAARPAGPAGASPGSSYAAVETGEILPNIPSQIHRVYLRDIPLKDALTAILGQMGLSYKVEDGFIWVSRPDILRRESFEPLETRFYQLQSAGGESLPKVAMMTYGGMAGGGAPYGGGYGGYGGGGAYGMGGAGSYGTGGAGGYGGYGAGGAQGYGGYGGNYGGGVVFNNILQLCVPVNHALVGEPEPVIGLGGRTAASAGARSAGAAGTGRSGGGQMAAGSYGGGAVGAVPFNNIMQLFAPVNHALVGEPEPVIGLAGQAGSRASGRVLQTWPAR